MKFFYYIKREKKPDIFYILCILLSFAAILSVIRLFNINNVWGSQTDWIIQHFSIPEYFRSRFYETGDLFPDFASELGAGQNIYYLSYYGIMNPVYLFSYLMPQIRMADYIQFVSVISVLVSAIMCYYLMKKHYSPDISALLAVLFICSAPILFHSHRHIMFTSYYPFLFIALFAVNKNDDIISRALLIISSCFILCSSFYYSISAFAVIVLYAVFSELKENNSLNIRELAQSLLNRIICIAAGCLVAGIMWAPTLYALINGRAEGSADINAIKLIIPTVNLKYILYGSYSAGMTAIAAAALIVTLICSKRHIKLLSAVILAIICLPIIIYLCNGTMYIDSKVLIPFVPLILLICGDFLETAFSRRINLPMLGISMAVILVLDLIFSNSGISFAVKFIADTAVLILSLALYRKYKRKSIVYLSVAAVAFVCCISSNLSDEFAPEDSIEIAYSKDITSLADKASACDKGFYRFAGETNSLEGTNRTYGDNYQSTNIYSSVSNPDYRSFRFESLFNENANRNNAIHSQPSNIIFNTLMGCRYRISTENVGMYGEEMLDTAGEYSLYINESALPVGYASANIMSEQEYLLLDESGRAEAMLKNIIVPTASSDAISPSQTKQLECGYTVSGDTSKIKRVNSAYEVNSNDDFSLTVDFDEPITDRLLLISMQADNRVGDKEKRDDIFVTINGVKNTLSDPEWKYNNHNYSFRYVISSAQPIERLELEFSKGNYIISDIKLFTLEGSVLTKADENKDEFVPNKSTGGDTISGSINVTQDGWFNISIPYDKGFEIYVDGKKTEYYKTNTAFIGFPVARGEHIIKIEYHAPLKSTGLIITLAGIICTAIMLITPLIRKG